MRLTFLILFAAIAHQLSAQEADQVDFLSQEYFIAKALKSAEQYESTHPVEKVYIHFDRPFYLVSDTAWFNIYVVDSQLNQASNSIAVFVDWIHEDGSLAKHQQFKITNGSAAGNFAFLNSAEGVYHVRAYTNLMMKADTAYLFNKKLNLINPFKLNDSPTTSSGAVDSIDLQFFPEGGLLINGLESQVAFKAVDFSGKGVDFTAGVLDDLKQPITTMKSKGKGMGVFTIKPMEGRSYKVVWNNKVFALPKPLQSGVVMSVNNRVSDFIEVKIQASDDLIPGKFYLIGQCQNRIVYRDMFTVSETTAVLQVPKKSIPQGVLQLTLFDENYIPRCERMVFSNQETDLQIEIRFNKSVYGPRELVSVNLDVTDKNGLPVQAQMSVAITDVNFVKRDLTNENIRTHLLLQSDLKGKIENPGWYFESVDEEKVYALDLVMLTHGWRRFIWEKVLAEKPGSAEYLPEDGLSVSGRVVAGQKVKSVPLAGITLITDFNKKSKVFTASADQEGNFTINDLMFDDSTKFVWQIRDRRGQPLDAQVIFASPKIPSSGVPKLSKTASHQKDLSLNEIISRMQSTGVLDSYKFKLLEEVEIRGEKIVGTQDSRTSIIPESYHRLSVKPTANEAVNYTDVTKMIRDKFPNVTFIGAGINMDIRIRGYNKVLMKKEMSPLILLDGQIILSDSLNQGGVYHALNIIPVSEIEKIEVLSGAAASIYGSRAGAGAIAIYSKGMSGKVIVDNSGPGMGVLKIVPPGFDWPKQFYQPKYEQNILSDSVDDRRITLFWNPQIQTDESGNTQLQFYNSDIARSFQVVVEGMAKGVPLFGVK